ncbi:MAG: hypothetical protein BWX81_02252 [Spirochaetes bacterium ADurb.Bin110]|nr:MAG: hypothetical protein BWX81_02252 [Spirochaetes bacterium ADurb.Bin110]
MLTFYALVHTISFALRLQEFSFVAFAQAVVLQRTDVDSLNNELTS